LIPFLIAWLQPLPHETVVSTKYQIFNLILVVLVVLVEYFVMIWIILLVEFQSTLRWYINRIKSFKHFFMNHILVFRGNRLYIFAFILNTKTCNCNCLLISLISWKSYIITLWSLSGLLTIKMLLRSSFLESLH